MDSIDHLLPSRLLCPTVRTKYIKNRVHKKIGNPSLILVDNSYYMSNAEDDESSSSHHLLPLIGCNNKETELQPHDDLSEGCGACWHNTIGTTYYYCNQCDKWYHKECVESPPTFKSPYHPKHSLQLYISDKDEHGSWELECHSCSSIYTGLVYHCSLCDFSLDPVCAAKPPFINHQKRHEHTLYFFPRKSVLICDVCGLDDNKSFSFVCLQCDFVVHKSCIYLPYVIRISRHKHRISFVYSLPSQELSCGVCRKKIDETYGAYSCMSKGCSYVVHSKCATKSPYIWDGQELEGEPEEVNEIVKPSFVVISHGIIRHCSHSKHPLRLEEDVKLWYDERKYCHACLLPLCDGNAYTCMDMECDYMLHETCAYLPRVIQHALHAHSLTLVPSLTQTSKFCLLCRRAQISRLKYVCYNGCDSSFDMDIKCASISEPYVHHSHRHPLFITYSRPNDACSICDATPGWLRSLNCDECDFILCFSCATLPYKVRDKNDEHLLTFSYEKDANGIYYWCDLCEERIDPRRAFYSCNECEVTLHSECLLGVDLHMKPGSRITVDGREFNIVQNSALTRPICNECGRRCPYRVMFIAATGDIYCSTSCIYNIYIRTKLT